MRRRRRRQPAEMMIQDLEQPSLARPSSLGAHKGGAATDDSDALGASCAQASVGRYSARPRRPPTDERQRVVGA
eukprot:scaffold129948_cov33-Tisochrysis_lutea.AAC.3